MIARIFALGVVVALSLNADAAETSVPSSIEFNRDVRPILSEHCFVCHGPDHNRREAELRLDTQEGLVGQGRDVKPVVAGKLQASELLRRITSSDPDLHMPPASTGKQLSPREIAILRQWIEQGAKWQGHWAYQPLQRPSVPRVDEPGFVRGDIDRYIRARQQSAGVSHAPEADRRTLIRRLSFDLRGLPPSEAEVDAFVADSRVDAYEQLVDRLLATPQYGERMAAYWLDLVRYADSIGYHSDTTRNIAPYRDYVINAFNNNMPFDRFTIEQLAGDLLDHPTLEQQVASGYNRLLQTTEEGGAQPKEYAAKYLGDRVRNVSAVWLGATMACCECHDHKYDPLTMRDFYSLAAFFADVRETPVGKREPGVLVPNAEQASRLNELEQGIATAKRQLERDDDTTRAAEQAWEAKYTSLVNYAWRPIIATRVEAEVATLKVEGNTVVAGGTKPDRDRYTLTFKGPFKRTTALRLEVLPEGNNLGRGKSGHFAITRLQLQTRPGNQGANQNVAIRRVTASPDSRGAMALIAATNDAPHWISTKPQVAQQAIIELATPLELDDKAQLTVTVEQQLGQQQTIARLRLSDTTTAAAVEWNERESLPVDVLAAIDVSEPKRTPAQRAMVRGYGRGQIDLFRTIREQIAQAEKALTDYQTTVPRSLVTQVQPPAMVRILARGNWMDDSGPVMQPAVPTVLGKLDTGERRASRLDLARWLVSSENPVTARVLVNRLWKLFFGVGLSKTLEDFGSQGEWPTHGELLDALAIDLRDSGWNIKRLVRAMVTSGAYRQASNPKSLAAQQVAAQTADPDNRWLWRANRFRIEAEMVRDNALEIAGVLSHRVGGESVRPYQPDGYWDYLNFPKRTYTADSGEKQHRRGLYTHWQRSFLHPQMMIFDATSREECTAERPRSNTPQQALAMLNDPTFVEAAVVFARQIATSAADDAGRLRWAYRRALQRAPSDAESKVLLGLLTAHRQQFALDSAAAEQAIKASSPSLPTSVSLPPTLTAADWAAWTSVARALLNLHETITRL